MANFFELTSQPAQFRKPFGFPEGVIVPGSLAYIEPARDGLSPDDLFAGGRLTNWARGALANASGGNPNDSFASWETVDLGNAARLEMTSAGALHGFFNTAVAADDQIAKLSLPQDIIAYVDAHPTHSYYFDAVVRMTAQPAMDAAGISEWMLAMDKASPASTDNVLAGLYHRADSDLGDANRVWLPGGSAANRIAGAADLLTPGALTLARAAVSGVPSGWDAANTDFFVQWRGAREAGGTLAGGIGYIFYSMCMEDLTVSGRKYSEPWLARQRQITREYGPGGRYDGETWTDPDGVIW